MKQETICFGRRLFFCIKIEKLKHFSKKNREIQSFEQKNQITSPNSRKFHCLETSLFFEGQKVLRLI